MAVEKDAEKDKKTLQIKATTGAWWKSTTSDDVSSDTPSDAAEPVKKATAAKQKADPQKRTRKKPQKTAAAGPAAVETVQEPSEDVEGKGPAKKPSRRRSTRKTKAAGVEKTAEQPASAKQTDDVSAADVVAEPVAAIPAEEKTAPKRSRGRRGRGSGKKAAAVAEERSPATEKTKKDAQPVAGSGEAEKAVKEEAETVPVDGEQDDSDTASESQPSRAKTAKAAPRKEESKKVCKLLINAEEPEECRLALLEDGRLESIHVSTISRTQTKSNIYKLFY